MENEMDLFTISLYNSTRSFFSESDKLYEIYGAYQNAFPIDHFVRTLVPIDLITQADEEQEGFNFIMMYCRVDLSRQRA